MINLKKDCPSLNQKSEKLKTLLTSRQKKLLAENDFFTVFNEIHNPHLSSKVGQVEIKTGEKKKNRHKQKS